MGQALTVLNIHRHLKLMGAPLVVWLGERSRVGCGREGSWGGGEDEGGVSISVCPFPRKLMAKLPGWVQARNRHGPGWE